MVYILTFWEERIMEPTREEKTIRLHDMLQEALKPMIEKLEKMEQEIKELKESQEEIRNMLVEKTFK
jgi:uncharacterized protein (UPF0335 family)